MTLPEQLRDDGANLHRFAPRSSGIALFSIAAQGSQGLKNTLLASCAVNLALARPCPSQHFWNQWSLSADVGNCRYVILCNIMCYIIKRNCNILIARCFHPSYPAVLRSCASSSTFWVRSCHASLAKLSTLVTSHLTRHSEWHSGHQWAGLVDL